MLCVGLTFAYKLDKTNFGIVAKFPLWLAIPSCLPNRTAIFSKDKGPLLTTSHVDHLVERHADCFAAGILSRYRFQGKYVFKTDCSDEGSGMECGRDAQAIRPWPTRTHEKDESLRL